MRALTPPQGSFRWRRFREHVAVSMWFVPALFVAGAMLLSQLTLWLDRRLGVSSEVLPGSTPGAAETVSATIAAGMLTFTGVVFSTTLVAIQLAGGQYSPRIVRVFVRSRTTHVTLGVFLATFLFALNGLAATRDGTRDEVPSLTLLVVYLMMLATLVTFLVFAHHIVQLLRVQYLLRIVTEAGREAIERDVPPACAYRDVPAPRRSAEPVDVGARCRPGVLTMIDPHRLVRLAARHGCWIELLVAPGQYVSRDAPVARMHGAAEPPDEGAVRACLAVGPERTLVQDPGFALRQLVDVSARALSPAVNDPTTAVQAIDRVSDLLATLSARPDPSGLYCDADGVVRLSVLKPGFAKLAALGLTEPARYGAGSPQVVRRLLAAYDTLERTADPVGAEVIRGLRRQLLAAAGDEVPAAFREVATRPDPLGLG